MILTFHISIIKNGDQNGNQNGEHFVDICESDILETSSHIFYCIELAGTSLPVESTINTKIKITHHRVKADGSFIHPLYILIHPFEGHEILWTKTIV